MTTLYQLPSEQSLPFQLKFNNIYYSYANCRASQSAEHQQFKHVFKQRNPIGYELDTKIVNINKKKKEVPKTQCYWNEILTEFSFEWKVELLKWKNIVLKYISKKRSSKPKHSLCRQGFSWKTVKRIPKAGLTVLGEVTTCSFY